MQSEAPESKDMAVQKDQENPKPSIVQAETEPQSPEDVEKGELASKTQTIAISPEPEADRKREDFNIVSPYNSEHGKQSTALVADEPMKNPQFTTDPVLMNGKETEVTKPIDEAEFETDSSPLVSSSDESSDTSSPSDDSDAEDYVMLDPVEAARLLMAEDGGSDNDRPDKGGKAIANIPRTLNEKPDEVVPKPDVTITPDMALDELGHVENMVENLALIKATTSGEYQVLESGSILCLDDRTVIGVVAETLGRVQQPYYSVRFTNPAAMAEAGIKQGVKVYFVKQFSHTVFTQPLKAYKGSDASNLHDEEIGDEELEFSDDEAEAEHKRRVKEKKRAKYDGRQAQSNGHAPGSQQRNGGTRKLYNMALPSLPERPPDVPDLALNYDDGRVEDHDELYTPLARPSNLHEMMVGEQSSVKDHLRRGNSHTTGRDRGGRERGRGVQGRGNRGADRGGRGDWRNQGSRGALRGECRASSQHLHAHTGAGQISPSSTGFSQPPQNRISPPPAHGNGFPSPLSQTNGFPPYQPRQPPPPSPISRQAYSTQPQIYPNYAFQPPSDQSQSYTQPSQYQDYQYQYPHQQNSFQYYQPPQVTSQIYQNYTYPQYPAQQPSPTPPDPANLPPGAHINPNFFRQQNYLQQQPSQMQPPPGNSNAVHTNNPDFAKYI